MHEQSETVERDGRYFNVYGRGTTKEGVDLPGEPREGYATLAEAESAAKRRSASYGREEEGGDPDRFSSFLDRLEGKTSDRKVLPSTRESDGPGYKINKKGQKVYDRAEPDAGGESVTYGGRQYAMETPDQKAESLRRQISVYKTELDDPDIPAADKAAHPRLIRSTQEKLRALTGEHFDEAGTPLREVGGEGQEPPQAIRTAANEDAPFAVRPGFRPGRGRRGGSLSEDPSESFGRFLDRLEGKTPGQPQAAPAPAAPAAPTTALPSTQADSEQPAYDPALDPNVPTLPADHTFDTKGFKADVASAKAMPEIAVASTSKLLTETERRLKGIDAGIDDTKKEIQAIESGKDRKPTAMEIARFGPFAERGARTTDRSPERLAELKTKLKELEHEREVLSMAASSAEAHIEDVTPKDQTWGGKILTGLAGSATPTLSAVVTGMATGNPVLGLSMMGLSMWGPSYVETVEAGDTARERVASFDNITSTKSKVDHLQQAASDRGSPGSFRKAAGEAMGVVAQAMRDLEGGKITREEAIARIDKAWDAYASVMQYVAKSATLENAELRSLIDMGAEILGENVPLGIAMKKGMPIIERVLKTMFAEAIQEGLITEPIQTLTEWAATNPKMTWGEAIERMALAAGTGAAMGGAFGAGAHLVEKSYDKQSKRDQADIDKWRKRIYELDAMRPQTAPVEPIGGDVQTKTHIWPRDRRGPAGATHTLEDGTPVRPATDKDGNVATGLFVDNEGKVHEGKNKQGEWQVRPIGRVEPNATIEAGGVEYDVQVIAKGNASGTARLADGQEVKIDQLELDDKAKKLLGIPTEAEVKAKEKADADKKAADLKAKADKAAAEAKAAADAAAAKAAPATQPAPAKAEAKPSKPVSPEPAAKPEPKKEVKPVTPTAEVAAVPPTAFHADLERRVQTKLDSGADNVQLADHGFAPEEVTALEQAGLATRGTMDAAQFAGWKVEREKRVAALTPQPKKKMADLVTPAVPEEGAPVVVREAKKVEIPEPDETVKAIPESAFDLSRETGLGQITEGQTVGLKPAGFTAEEIAAMEKAGMASRGMMSATQHAAWATERARRMKVRADAAEEARLNEEALKKAQRSEKQSARAKQNIRERTKVKDDDTILDFLAKAGGLNLNAFKEFVGKSYQQHHVPFVGNAFHVRKDKDGKLVAVLDDRGNPRGMDIDRAAEAAFDAGYLTDAEYYEGATRNAGGIAALTDKISETLTGAKKHYAYDSQARLQQQRGEIGEAELPPQEGEPTLAESEQERVERANMEAAAAELLDDPSILDMGVTPESLEAENVEVTPANIAITNIMATLPPGVANRILLENESASDEVLLEKMKEAAHGKEERGGDDRGGERGKSEPGVAAKRKPIAGAAKAESGKGRKGTQAKEGAVRQGSRADQEDRAVKEQARGEKPAADIEAQGVTADTAIRSPESAVELLTQGVIEPDPARNGQCYRFAGRAAEDGKGDFLIATLVVQGERIWHAVVVDNENRIYEPIYGRWFEDGVLQDLFGLDAVHRMTGEQVTTFGVGMGVWPSPVQLGLRGADKLTLQEGDYDTIPLVKPPKPEQLTSVDRPTRVMGYEGLHERMVRYPVEQISDTSVTTPQFTGPTADSSRPSVVTAVVDNPNDPNSAIQIIDGWPHVRAAMARRDTHVLMRMLFDPKHATRTPQIGTGTAFDRFIGGTKVLDWDGNPRPVYHATDVESDFTEFDTMDLGSWFMESPDEAMERHGEKSAEGHPRLIPVYLSIKNPLYIPSTIDLDDTHSVDFMLAEINHANNTTITREDIGLSGAYGAANLAGYEAISHNEMFFAEATRLGFDGLHAYENGLVTWNAFSPEQIKSTIGNRGTYHPRDPSIIRSRRQGFYFDATESPLYEKREPRGPSAEQAAAALRGDATARRVMAKGIEPQQGELVGVRLNINVMKSTGVAVQTIHRGNKGLGYQQNRGLWGGEVISYAPVVTLNNAYFNVHQAGREAIARGESSKFPMASIDGNYVKTDTHNFDGVEFHFNPKREHLFVDSLGRVLRHAESVTIAGNAAYARGKIEYYGPEDVPARAGDAPSAGRVLEVRAKKGEPSDKDQENPYEPAARVGDVLELFIPADKFKRITDEWAELMREPGTQAVRIDKKAEAETLTPEQAKERIDGWKKHARKQGRNQNYSPDNFNKTVLSLFDITGEWSRPWLEAGYNVITFDLQTGQDVRDFSAEYFVENWDISDVYAIIAACPCTEFASSGARWFAEKDKNGRTKAAVELVHQTLRTIEFFRPKVWAIENPVGRIQRLTGLPSPRLSFDPHHFGDPYTKRTQVYGKFNAENMPTANVAPTEGSKMHKMWSTAETEEGARSITPEGFAYSFFMANNYQDLSPEDRLTGDYPEASGAVLAAYKAGVSEKRIRKVMYDTYENYEYEEAQEALRAEVEKVKEKAKVEPKAETAEILAGVTKLREMSVTFASGMTAAADLATAANAAGGHENRGVGVDVGQLSPAGIKTLGRAVIDWKTQVFVDSGAFSLFRRKVKGEKVALLDFDAIFKRYDQIIDEIDKQNPQETQGWYRPLLVMPDIVGDQIGSLALLHKHRDEIRSHIDYNLSDPVVPIQKGELSLAEAYREAVKILGSDDFIVGIPSNEKAVSIDELREFINEIRPTKIHFLGASSHTILNPRLAVLAQAGLVDEIQHLSSDASPIRNKIVEAGQTAKQRQRKILDETFDLAKWAKQEGITIDEARYWVARARGEAPPVDLFAVTPPGRTYAIRDESGEVRAEGEIEREEGEPVRGVPSGDEAELRDREAAGEPPAPPPVEPPAEPAPPPRELTPQEKLDDLMKQRIALVHEGSAVGERMFTEQYGDLNAMPAEVRNSKAVSEAWAKLLVTGQQTLKPQLDAIDKQIKELRQQLGLDRGMPWVDQAISEEVEALAREFEEKGDTFSAVGVRNLLRGSYTTATGRATDEESRAIVRKSLEERRERAAAIAPMAERIEDMARRFDKLGMKKDAQALRDMGGKIEAGREARIRTFLEAIEKPLPETIYDSVGSRDNRRSVPFQNAATAASRVQGLRHGTKVGKFNIVNAGDGVVIKVLEWPGGIKRDEQGGIFDLAPPPAPALVAPTQRVIEPVPPLPPADRPAFDLGAQQISAEPVNTPLTGEELRLTGQSEPVPVSKSPTQQSGLFGPLTPQEKLELTPPKPKKGGQGELFSVKKEIIDGVAEVEQAIHDYETGEGNIDTVGDLANAIDAVLVNAYMPKLEAAVEAYRNEQRENAQLKGRGDMDTADANFIQQLKEVVDEAKDTAGKAQGAVEGAERAEAETTVYPAIPIPGTTAVVPAKVRVELDTVDAVRTPGGRVTTHEQAAQVFKQLARFPREVFQVLVVNDAQQPIAVYEISRGGTGKAQIDQRELLASVYMTEGAASIWFGHNHPTSTAEPSPEDSLFTQQMAALFGPRGIQVAGHVTISGFDYAIVPQAGLDLPLAAVVQPIPAVTSTTSVPLKQRVIKHWDVGRQELSSVQAYKDYLNELNPRQGGVLLLDDANRVIGWWADSDFNRSDYRELFRAVGRDNPTKVILWSPGETQFSFARKALRLRLAIADIDVEVQDAVMRRPDGSLQSFKVDGYQLEGRENEPPIYFSLGDDAGERRGSTVLTLRTELRSDPLYQAMGDDIEIVQTVHELPREAFNIAERNGTLNRVRGVMMPDGKIWLVAGHIAPGDGQLVLMHEAVGHWGVVEALKAWGVDPTDMFLQIYGARSRDIHRYLATKPQYVLDYRTELGKATAAAEWLAHRAEEGLPDPIDRTIWQKFVDWLRAAFSSTTRRQFSDDDILALLQASRSHILRGRPYRRQEQAAAKGESEAPRPRLSALHNLTAENLRFSDQLGGIPVPSVAVVPEHMGVDDIGGEITLIGKRELGDPARVPVFDADAYSPRFPPPLYDRVAMRKAQPLVNEIRPWSEKFDDYAAQQETWDYSVNNPKPAEILRRWRHSSAAKAMFLAERGVNVEPTMRDKPVQFPWVKYLDASTFPTRVGDEGDARLLIREAVDKWLREDKEGQDLVTTYGTVTTATEPADVFALARAAAVTKFGVKGEWVNALESDERLGTEDEIVPLSVRHSIEDDFRRLGQTEVDRQATEDALKVAMIGREGEFNSWVEKKVMALFGQPFLRVRGRRVPFTMPNIVEAMTGRVRGREAQMTFSEGMARASASRRFTGLEQMRRAADRQVMPTAVVAAAREAAQEAMQKWRDQVVQYHHRGEALDVWSALDASMRAIARWARGGQTELNLRRQLAREGFDTAAMDEDLFAEGVAAGRLFMRAPVPYFEAKPQRAVRLSEFAGAVIPDTALRETREILKKHGIPFKVYAGGRSQQSSAAAKFRDELAGQGEPVYFSLADEPQGPLIWEGKEVTLEELQEQLDKLIKGMPKRTEARTVRVKDRLRKLLRERDKWLKRREPDPRERARRRADLQETEFAEGVRALTDEIEHERRLKREAAAQREKARGADWWRERLIRARRNEELSEEQVNFALWLIEQNPSIAADLALSIREKAQLPGQPPSGALYYAWDRLVVLSKADKPGTPNAVHEILHHTERMMPLRVQNGILREYERRLVAAYNRANDFEKEVLIDFIKGMAGDQEAYNRAFTAVTNGYVEIPDAERTERIPIRRSLYQFANESEFWAVNATRIMSARYEAKQRGWIARARQWLTEFVEKMKGWFGLQSDAPVLAGLRRVLNGDGSFATNEMLNERLNRRGGRIFSNVPSAAPGPTAAEPSTIYAIGADGRLRGIARKKNGSATWELRVTGQGNPLDLVRDQKHTRTEVVSPQEALRIFGDHRLTPHYAIPPALSNTDKAIAESLGRRYDLDDSDASKLMLSGAHPRTIASFDPDAAPVVVVAEQQFEARDQIVSELKDEMKKYDELSRAEKRRVNAVLELGRLNKTVYGTGQAAIDVTNTDKPNAVLSKVGDRFELTDKEKSGYWAIRRTMNRALGLVRNEMVRAHGLNPHRITTPEQVLAHIDRVESGAEQPAREGELALEGGRGGRMVGWRRRELHQLAANIEELLDHRRTGYIPFTRWGDYAIVVKRGDSVIHYEQLEHEAGEDTWIAKRAARNRADELREKFPNAIVSEPMQLGRASGLAPVDLGMLDMLARAAHLDQAGYEAMRTELAAAQKRLGFRAHMQKAWDIPGYSGDIERAVADYIIGLASHLSRTRYREEWEQAIGKIPSWKGDLIHWARDYRGYANAPREEWQRLRTFGYVMYIAGVPMTAAVNLTQPWMTTWPLLQVFTNTPRATWELTRAHKDALSMVDLLHLFQPNEVFNPKPKQQGGSGVLDSEPELRDALLTAWNKGYMAPMTTMEMMGVAQERGELLRGLEHGTRKTIEAVSFMFMGAERMNRLTSYIAAYRVANQPGMKEKILATLKDNALAQLAFRSSENFPAAFAEWVVDETQFRTGRVNRAELQRGVGTALLQFKDFPWQMIEFYARTARLAGPRGKVAFAMMMLLMLLLAGVWGLPFGDNFRRVIESVLKMITERDRDLKVELREKIKELTGSKRIAEMVSYGVVRGIDESPEMSSRVGLGSILPDFTKPEQLLGIPGDLFYSRPKKAIEWFKRDEKQLSIASVLPNVLKNVVEAEYWSQEGVRPQPATGGRVLGPEQLSTSDIVWKGLGARTRRVAEASEEGMMIQRMAHAQDEMRRNYYYRIGVNLAREVMARNVGNADAEVQAAKRVQEALTEIRAYNEGKPVHQQIVLNLRSLGEVVGRELVGTKFQDARLPRISRQRAAEIRALSGSNEAEPEWLQ